MDGAKIHWDDKEDVPEAREGCQHHAPPSYYTDDLNDMILNKGGSRREEIETSIKSKGENIEKVLRKLGLMMNKTKTQIINCMSYQRRKPGNMGPQAVRQFNSKMSVEIGGIQV